MKQIIDLVSLGSDGGTHSSAEPSQAGSTVDTEATAYVRSIPNRHARAKKGHQQKE